MDHHEQVNRPIDIDLVAPMPQAVNNVKWLILILIFGVIGLAVWYVSGPMTAMAGWHDNFDDAINDAAQKKKPVFVLFTAGWCPPCRQLKSSTLKHAEVYPRLNGDFVCLVVDLTDRHSPNNEHAETFGVEGIPTMIVFDISGNEVDRQSGSLAPDEFLMWLDAVEAQALRGR